MAEREGEPRAIEAIKKLKADAILSHTTDGMTDSEVFWVTPSELREAVLKLKAAIQADQPEAKIILATYERNANGIDPVSEEFMRDLADVEALANWAEEEGATKMTLEVNW